MTSSLPDPSTWNFGADGGAHLPAAEVLKTISIIDYAAETVTACHATKTD